MTMKTALTLAILGPMCAVFGAEDRVVGWRGDGSGHFADANPPTKFSMTENLRWKVGIGQGCGATIVVGDRLFVQAAPNALLCLDKTTGKELWRRTHHAQGLAPTSPEATLDAIMDDVGAYHVAIQRLRVQPKDAANRAEAEAEVKLALDKLPKDALGRIPGAKDGGYNCGGIHLICMTPCSDGRTVVAVFPTGVAVAYDLHGARLWSIGLRLPPPKKGFAGGCFSTCPVYSAEGVVVAIFGSAIFGIDGRNGKVLWQEKVNSSNASPVLGRINGQSYVASGDGCIFRVHDGRRVFTDPTPGGMESPPTPVFADGVFYWISHAVRVRGGEEPAAEVLWDQAGTNLAKITGWGVKEQKRTGPGDMTSPLLHNGALLHYNQRTQIVSLDAATGKESRERRSTSSAKRIQPLSGGVTKNWAYGGMILAGNRIIVIHDNGVAKVIPSDEKTGEVVVNTLPDDVYAQPTCDGRALYVRTVNSLYRFDNPTVVISGANPFVDKTEITLQSPHEGSIRYTLDGSEPTAQSTSYAATIVLDRTATVSAAVFGVDGKPIPSSRREFIKMEARRLAADQWVKAREVYELDGPGLGDDKESIQWINNGAVIAFGPYEIADNLKTIELMIGLPPDRAGGKVHIRLDSKTGRKIGTHQFQSTGGWQQYQSQKIALSEDPSGKHMLWFEFEGGYGICNLKQFMFTK